MEKYVMETIHLDSSELFKLLGYPENSVITNLSFAYAPTGQQLKDKVTIVINKRI